MDISNINTEHLTRQIDILPMDKLDQKITVIGAGAIGSFTVLSLVKMGFQNIKVYDFDDVSIENMSCQWYRFEDIGKKKVLALKDLINQFTKVEIDTCEDKFENQQLDGIVVSAVDSMEARKNIWDICKDSFQVSYLVDPRMASETSTMYVMDVGNPKDRLAYEKTLFSDSDGVQERCTAKNIMHTGMFAAGQVCKAIKDIVLNEKYPRVMNWSIKEDSLTVWRSDGTNTVQIQEY